MFFEERYITRLGCVPFLRFMKNFLYLESTASTNDDAYQLALKGADHGFGVIADCQSAGKGRLGKEWLSPRDTGLYCSIVLRPQLPFAEFPKLTLTAGLALCATVEKILPSVSFGLKWPNDLFASGKKSGGILVESSSPNTQDDNPFVVVGIGLNVNTTRDMFPFELQGKATSLHLLGGGNYVVSELYQEIHKALLDHIHIHETQGFKAILAEWRKRDVLIGKVMQWVTFDKKIIKACGMGPDANGQLLARDGDGRIHKILSGDVQLVR